MILPDVNLLIYAIDATSPFHRNARLWWEAALSSTTPVGLSHVAVMGFIRLVTNRRVFTSPLPADAAVRHVDSWLDQPNVSFAVPGPRHWAIFSELMVSAAVAGNLVTDAHLAALAMEQGYTLHSNDRDFGAFEGLRWVNPLNE